MLPGSPEHHVAREQKPDRAIRGKGLVGEVRVAGSKDEVRLEVHAKLFLESLLDVDLRQDAEPLSLQRVDHLRLDRVDGAFDSDGHPVACHSIPVSYTHLTLPTIYSV